MAHDRQDYWTQVYDGKSADAVSWYQASPESSLQALDRFGATSSSAFIDIGGGASNLVDALLDRDWQDVTVLDLAPPALEAAKARLGARQARVAWTVADITDWQPERRYDVWHDRAVFHFLTEPAQRAAYHCALGAGIAPGGLVIIATFAPDGPERCSGLPVERYDRHKLAAELGASFALLECWREEHVTPWGSKQAFTWCAFRAAT